MLFTCIICTMISSVDRAHCGACHAKDWLSVDCGLNSFVCVCGGGGGGKAIVFCSDSFRHSLSQYIYFRGSSNPIADYRGEKTRRLGTPQGMKFCHFYYKGRSFNPLLVFTV